VQVAQDPLLFTASLWDEGYLDAVILFVVAFGAWRVAAVIQAMCVGRPIRHWRALESGVAVALVVTIVGMHGAVAATAWNFYETSLAMESNDFLDIAMATPSPQTPEPTPRVPPTFPSFAPASPTNPIAASSPTAPPNPNRITFLLVGVDFMAGRSTGSTDTLMVVSVDTVTKKAAMISLPRDTAGFQLYYGPYLAVNFKINGLLAALYNGKVKSPDPPMTTLEKEIGFLVGIPIDYYAAVDMDGFPRIVDAAGGVDVYNVRAINDSVAKIVLPVGPAHLDGATALKYVRTRENGGSDYLRASRQQQVLVSLKNRLLSASGIGRLNTVLSLVGKTVATDFPLKTAKDYVRLGQTLSTLETCVLGPPFSWHPDTSTTRGSWVSRLNMSLVANLSVHLFGQDSAYYGQIGVSPGGC
jgi:polyisoprenyl-teichoic acid--peptidoglycan teichoic acid transferase